MEETVRTSICNHHWNADRFRPAFNFARRLISLALLAGAFSASAAPVLEFSQNGKDFAPFEAIEGTAKAATYYDYYTQSGHPAFGTPKATSTAAMYWDEKRSALSLIIVSGSAESKDSGQVRYKLDNLPWSTYLSLSDDPGEYEYDKGQELTTPRFVYKNGADGVIYSGLEKSSWVIKISLSQIKGVKYWRLANDGETSDAFVGLDMKKPLYLRYQGEDDEDDDVVVPPPPTTNQGGGKKRPRSVMTKTFTPPSGNLPLLGPYKVLPGSNNPGGGGIGNPIPEPGGILMLAGLGMMLLRRGQRG